MKRIVLLVLLIFFVGTLSAFGKSTATEVTIEKTSEGITVTHSKGEAVFTSYPKNIATLSVFHTDYLLALGIIPISTVTYDYKSHKHLPYLEEELEGVFELGSQSSPDIERLIDRSPDLILGEKEHEKHYDTLNKIAPTIILGKTENWRSYLEQVAGIVGKETEAEAVIANYNQKAEAVKDKLETEVGDETVLFLRVRPKELRVYGAQWNIGDVLYKDLGLTPASCVPMGEWAKPISKEVLPECNPDHILLQVDDDEKSQKLVEELLEQSSIWGYLDAVKNGNVYPIEHWFIMSGPLSNEAKINRIEELLIN
ncbi:ABC transporter substrate-binding protein [Bacillus sp. DJP31]|uniref:ABC transporter substrate-binding protein n=1 Tax=Bacillus sp. DJP31 TaxID=3409789 RepID=UPI003BB4C9E0